MAYPPHDPHPPPPPASPPKTPSRAAASSSSSDPAAPNIPPATHGDLPGSGTIGAARLSSANEREIWCRLKSDLRQARDFLAGFLTAAAKKRLPKPEQMDEKKREMTWDEKELLAAKLSILPTAQVERLRDFLKFHRWSHAAKNLDGKVIEINILQLDTETLWALDRFVTRAGSASNPRGNPPKPLPEIQPPEAIVPPEAVEEAAEDDEVKDNLVMISPPVMVVDAAAENKDVDDDNAVDDNPVEEDAEEDDVEIDIIGNGSPVTFPPVNSVIDPSTSGSSSSGDGTGSSSTGGSSSGNSSSSGNGSSSTGGSSSEENVLNPASSSVSEP